MYTVQNSLQIWVNGFLFDETIFSREYNKNIKNILIRLKLAELLKFPRKKPVFTFFSKCFSYM